MKQTLSITVLFAILVGLLMPVLSYDNNCNCCGSDMACCNLMQNSSCNNKGEWKCSPPTFLPVGPKPASIKVNNFTIVENVLSAKYSVISKDDISVTDFTYSLPPPKIPLYLKSHSFLI